MLPEIKNLLDELKSRLEMAEKKANELKRQINWNNLKNRKVKRKKKNRVSVTCGTIFKWSNIMELETQKKGKNWAQKVIKIVTNYFSNLVKTIGFLL